MKYLFMAVGFSVAPIGWFIGGFLAAQNLKPWDLAYSSSVSVSRPLYLSGNYLSESMMAAFYAVFVTWLFCKARPIIKSI